MHTHARDGAGVSGFVHLHCHSSWSLLDGAVPAEALAHLAAELGFEAVALTDHDALTGAVRFTKACRDAGVKPIFGAELTLAGDHHVTVIARDATGYANLCRLVSDAHLGNERRQPRTSPEAIAERSDGTFVLSGCARSEVASLAAAGRIPQAIEAARRWRRAIGDGYRIEVFDHRGYGHRALRDRLLKIAHEAGVQSVATNNVHYAIPEHAGTHEVLHAVREIVPLSVTHALRGTSEYYLKSAAAMRALFDDVTDACDETVRIAQACDYDLDLGSYHFPDFPIPRGKTPTGLLAHRCYEGVLRRYGRVSSAVDDRLQHELSVIFRMGFAAYFLLVADIVDHVRSMGIRCACRGSAAGSLVCYVLGISDVDPVRYDLLFERFINFRREELPDIDVDVESHRREEVLSYILDTYGSDQTAICCMVDTFRARMAIRDVGKALGLPPEEIDTVATSFPRIAARDIPAAVERLPELAGTNLRAGQLEQLFELCAAVDGFPRHLALHPSGVILSSSDLADRVPMQESFNGFTMLQADKHDVEDLGLVKLDVLGVRMLSSIAHARDEIERTEGRRVNLDALPVDDDATFELIRSSRTLGCFQIESPGQRELLARLQPNYFEDLIVDISLFRPGPVQSDMVGPYLQRRHGFEPVRNPHPRLEPILKETNGIIVFHEQLIRVIAAATGCSLDDADFVRRHLDSERPSRPDDPNSRPARRGVGSAESGMSAAGRDIPIFPPGSGRKSLDGPRSSVPVDNEVGEWFVEKAIANGFTPSEAHELWREVFAFASFGFCKSHAAAFALPTYISAYLKAHHTAAFIAGVLTHDPGMYPRRLIAADARNFGIPILPVDVNRSAAAYRVEGTDPRGIRLALAEVRDISAAEVDSILTARSTGPFTSLEDLWRRTELSQPVLVNLIHTGALDGIAGGRSRRELLWAAAELASKPKVRVGEQLALALDDAIVESLPDLPAYTPLEEVEAELEITGIDGRRHIMDLYGELLTEIGCLPARALSGARNRSQVWVAGAKVASQTPAIRSGQRIIFVTLDDPTGPIDVTVFERVQDRCARTVFHSWLLLIKGELRKRGGASFVHKTDPTNTGITVVVEDAFDLAELARDRSSGMSVADALDKQRARWTIGAETIPRRPALWHSSGGSAGR
ncbi:MAG: DNA polymerase III subunit alpha [Actinomycetota bacterium]